MVNEKINQLSELALKEAHNLTAQPAIIISSIVTLLLFLIIGLLGVSGARSKWKFFVIWIISIPFILIVDIALIKMPNLVQTIADFFRGLF